MISSPVPPNLRSLLDSFKLEVMAGINCHLLGKVVAINLFSRVASVQITQLRVLPDGSTQSYPLLTDIPVFTFGNNKALISVPHKAGDDCLVLFNDRDIDSWFVSGNTTTPNTPRTHSLSDGLALIGFRSKANPIPFGGIFDATIICLQEGASFIAVGESPVISSAHALVQVGTKIQIRASDTNLGDALNALCTALTTWVDTRGDTPNPATVAAINAAKALIDAVLI